eukprot:scpid105692/ scgid27666/ 
MLVWVFGGETCPANVSAPLLIESAGVFLPMVQELIFGTFVLIYTKRYLIYTGGTKEVCPRENISTGRLCNQHENPKRQAIADKHTLAVEYTCSQIAFIAGQHCTCLLDATRLH